MKLSIIVPVYKAEKFLHKCINSIISQPFMDWELILVDDGSPDKSGVICDEYASKDDRINVVHKCNEGVSVARNTGLDLASGDYVTFVDSDDSLEGDCFSSLINSSFDLIVFESISYTEDGAIKYWYDIADETYTNHLELESFIRKYINVFVLDGPCGKLIRRELIRDIRFPAGQPIGEDNVFMLSFMKVCQSVELRRGAYYVIDDHYENDHIKYRMTADLSLLCISNIFDAYRKLDISVPSFEKKMFHGFYNLIGPHCDNHNWYSNELIISLENRFLSQEARSFRIYYYCGRYRILRYISYNMFWKYVGLKNQIKKYFIEISKSVL